MGEKDFEQLINTVSPLLASQILIGSVTRQDFDVDYLYMLERLFIANMD